MSVRMPVKVPRPVAIKQHPRRYGALLLCVIWLTVLSPLVEHMFWARIFFGVSVLLALVTATVSAGASGRSLVGALFFAVAAASMWILSFTDTTLIFNPAHFHMAAYAMTLVLLVTICRIILKDVVSGEVTADRICGAVCVYFLIGFCFGMIHMMVYLTDCRAYSDGSPADEARLLSPQLPTQEKYPIFVYYSFCTLMTVGYGDITPLSRPARTISWLEAMIGQLYLTILLARLVGLHIAARSDVERDANRASLN
jgi:voltage-gated potassium channel